MVSESVMTQGGGGWWLAVDGNPESILGWEWECEWNVTRGTPLAWIHSFSTFLCNCKTASACAHWNCPLEQLTGTLIGSAQISFCLKSDGPPI